MPEPISQAAPAELVTPTSAQVPETATEPVSPQEEPPKEAPPTLEDYRKIAREEATKIAQSQVAKGETRIQKMIQEKFKALDQTKDTLGLSAEQVTQAKQKIVTDVYASQEEEPPETNQPTSPVSDVDQAIQYMNAQIANVYTEVGTSVSKSDPEFKALQTTVDAAWNDPNGLVKILLAAQKAAEIKAARLQKNSQGAAARVVGGGERTITTPKLSPSDKISQGLKGKFTQGPPPK